ncbi:MAG TPA: hypothetical protein VFG33_33595 [Kribbella sp.]|uniref:hypothetical protein n=1 Tax=Kribbella sp. TaxID=1871183 RepID=UPI002D795483|nr:hypothetical protein [Kribbella sp.]HET6298360.1 hypothetical protein [Kribbella sp.]
MTRATNLAARIAVLIALVAAAVWSIVQPALDAAEKKKETTITEVVSRGPVEVGDIEWKLESLRVYTQLADTEGKKVDVNVPAGASIVVAMMEIKPLDGVAMKNDGFLCDTQLMDDEDNIWKEADSVYGLTLPTGCSDEDHPLTRGKATKVMKVFVVPSKSVPRLVGLITPTIGTLNPEKRVLISL